MKKRNISITTQSVILISALLLIGNLLLGSLLLARSKTQMRTLINQRMMDIATTSSEILEMREMEVDHAENGQIVVDMFARSPEWTYDAILMDVRMPVMDGLQATAAIRALSRPDAKAVPIIAMTANAFDEDVQRSLQAGMNAHLSKPVEPERLYETLERMIRSDGQESGAQEGSGPESGAQEGDGQEGSGPESGAQKNAQE